MGHSLMIQGVDKSRGYRQRAGEMRRRPSIAEENYACLEEVYERVQCCRKLTLLWHRQRCHREGRQI